ncbi:hypothetical protein [Natrinema soli]|uniref:Uncharacterized protein n=1 Tax=Natrinema soli TaxID=1930624 RepID=A0ABD5SKD7_9EURY
MLRIGFDLRVGLVGSLNRNLLGDRLSLYFELLLEPFDLVGSLLEEFLDAAGLFLESLLRPFELLAELSRKFVDVLTVWSATERVISRNWSVRSSRASTNASKSPLAKLASRSSSRSSASYNSA